MSDTKNFKKDSPNATTLNEKAKYDEAAINEFVKKINLKGILPPKLPPANKLVVEKLNKEGIPKRPMNCFFCFRHILYLEVVKQNLLPIAKDGVFITNEATKVWNAMAPNDKAHFQKIANEIKKLQSDFQGKNYDKKPVATTFNNSVIIDQILPTQSLNHIESIDNHIPPTQLQHITQNYIIETPQIYHQIAPNYHSEQHIIYPYYTYPVLEYQNVSDF
ncbi:10272_t:CDS:2 [Funneliformis geosporum]|uniref:10272_t:CDS:1 n=1 Tax=Funneliformis geosporum TaxID=1117311 RepID=A0A9W4S9X5_9GLOM|nr:10272_t:CDS:2 [Funneliformis geosporum]